MCPLHWTPVGLLSDFPDAATAITSWFLSLTIPRGTAVIPDHVGAPESQRHPPNIPQDRAGLGSACPCQETWADLPIQQPGSRGYAEARWRLVKGNLCKASAQPIEAVFPKSRSQDTCIPIATLPRRESVTWSKSPLISELPFPLKREGVRLCALDSMYCLFRGKVRSPAGELGASEAGQVKVGQRPPQQPSLPGGALQWLWGLGIGPHGLL